MIVSCYLKFAPYLSELKTINRNLGTAIHHPNKKIIPFLLSNRIRRKEKETEKGLKCRIRKLSKTIRIFGY